MLTAPLESPPTPTDASVRGLADVRTTSDVEMGYGNCKLCNCGAYAEPYDNTQICATCKHNYEDHW
jgi:hypothetical protein